MVACHGATAEREGLRETSDQVGNGIATAGKAATPTNGTAIHDDDDTWC